MGVIQAPPTDFLLISKRRPNKEMPPGAQREGESFVIREIPKIYLCGQQEPLIEVFTPDQKDLNNYLDRMFRYCLSDRLNRSRVEVAGNKKREPEYRPVSYLDLHCIFEPCSLVMKDKNTVNAAVAARLAEVGYEAKNSFWLPKKAENVDVEREVTPEEVCAFESMVACLRRLLDAGITLVGHMTQLTPSRLAFVLGETLQNLQKNRAERLERARQSLRLLANEDRMAEAEENVKRLEEQLHDAVRLINVARQIHEEIQLTPWYLSYCYHQVMENKAGGGMFSLGSLGDPSGRGEEGFSYIPRTIQQGKTFKEVVPTLAPELQAIIKDTQWLKLSVAQMNEIITFLFTHQRRKSLANLASRGYDVKDPNELLKLNRGPKRERVQALLQVESSSDAKTSGRAQYKAAVQKIWNAQVNVLSNTACEDDTEAKEDDDEEDLFSDDFDGPSGQMGRAMGGGDYGGETEGDYAAIRARMLERLEQGKKAAASVGIHERPLKAVKRLIKWTDTNGQECYRVEFLVKQEDVADVQFQLKKKKVEEHKRQQQPKKKVKVKKHANILRLKPIKKPSAPKEEQPGGAPADNAGTGGGGGNKALLDLCQLFDEQTRLRQQQASQSAEDSLYQRELALTTEQKKNRGLNPKFTLSRILEEVLIKVQQADGTPPRFPVRDSVAEAKADAKTFGLHTVLKKIQRFIYKSSQEFVDDLHTFLADTKQKHGEQSDLSKVAGQLVAVGEEAVEANRAKFNEVEQEVALWIANDRGRKRAREAEEEEEGEEEYGGGASGGAKMARFPSLSSLNELDNGRGSDGESSGEEIALDEW